MGVPAHILQSVLQGAPMVAYDFRFTVDTTKTGVSGSDQFKLPLVSGQTYNFDVNWGDGNTSHITAYDQAEATHTFAASGVKNITITQGKRFGGWAFNNDGDKLKLTDITQWGLLPFGNASAPGAFDGCSNLITLTATDSPNWMDNSDATSFFASCTNFNSNIGHWDMSKVTSTYSMFSTCSIFNNGGSDSIGSWDVSKVTDFGYMFLSASVFNRNISGWNTSSATTMDGMFRNAFAFNQNIGGWNTSNVTSMFTMFRAYQGTETFNQNIGGWDVSKVQNFEQMFSAYSGWNSFNNGGSDSIKNWDTSSASNMSYMFERNNSFNQPLTNWDVSNVTTMYHMFYTATAFNGDVTTWEPTSCTNFGAMFYSAGAFSKDISGWDVSAATNMSYMFSNADSLYLAMSDFSAWNVANVTDMSGMFELCPWTTLNLANWDVSKVTTMAKMFYTCPSLTTVTTTNWNTSALTQTWQMFASDPVFNSDISHFDMSDVTNMTNMFNGCLAFNNGGSANINNWNTAKVTSLYGVFYNCQVFNQPIGSWDVSNVTDMSYTLQNCYVFNQPIGTWNTSKVISMRSMLMLAKIFNQNIGAWDVSKVTDMYGIFGSAYLFDNGGSDSIGNWNTSNVTTLEGAFGNANTFNRDIGGWNVTKCAMFYWCFANAFNFKQDLSSWDVKGVPSGAGNHLNTFFGAVNHSRPGYSDHLDNLYTLWNANPNIPTSKAFNAGTNIGYSFAGAAGRAGLISKGWTISGDVTNAITFDNNSGKLRGTYTGDMGTGTRVRFTTDTTLPTGLSSDTDYWTIRLTATTCRYATSLANALAGTAIDYADAGTGTHAQARYAWTVAASNSGGKILLTLNGSVGVICPNNNDARQVRFVSSDTLPTGLSPGVDYWLDRVNDVLYYICPSPRDAVANTNRVDYTDAGTGSHEVLLAPVPPAGD